MKITEKEKEDTTQIINNRFEYEIEYYLDNEDGEKQHTYRISLINNVPSWFLKTALLKALKKAGAIVDAGLAVPDTFIVSPEMIQKFREGTGWVFGKLDRQVYDIEGQIRRDDKLPKFRIAGIAYNGITFKKINERSYKVTLDISGVCFND